MSREMKLLHASLAGDRNAFEEIVAKYQSTICAITLSGTGRLDASEELAQETFVNAWEHLDQLRDLRGFRSWLYSIARNAVHNYRRRKKPASIELNLAEAVAKDTHNPPEILIRREERAMLEQAIMRLPDKYREPLVMFCREQRSIRASAEALGLTEATFRTRLHRARNLLREEVAERLEQVLKQTGPRKDFTKAVMVAVGTVPIGLSATADAALSGASGHALATSGISTVLSSMGMKIAAIAAVVTVTAFVYTHGEGNKAPAARDAHTQAVGQESSTTPLQQQADAQPAPTGDEVARRPLDKIGGHEEGARDELQPEQKATGIQEPADEPEQTPQQTIVTGTVLDKNTLDPVAGARVGFTLKETVVTDAEGHFRLSRTESREEAFVYAMAPGYALQRIALRMNIGGRQDVSLWMEPGLTLAGTVVDPNHNPIENVQVHIMGDRLTYPAVTTNAEGRFAMDGMHPEDASVYLFAEHADFVSSPVTPFARLGRLGEETFIEIVLTPKVSGTVLVEDAANTLSEPEAQATVEIDSTQDESPTVASLSGRIYGRVIDEDTNRPIYRFRVALGHGIGIAKRWQLDGYTFTSEKGHFDTGRLKLVPGEQLPLAVYADGYDPLTLESVPVQPVSENPDRTVCRLRRNERRSTVYVGHVVDTEGRGIQGAEVGFRRERYTDNRRGFSRVLTDASGTYMISSIDPHEQIVYARAPGYAPYHCRMSDLLLESPGAFANLILTSAASICGYVWDEFGQAIANTDVVSSPVVDSQEAAELTMLLAHLWAQTQTDERGHYQLTGLPIGEVHVFVRCEDRGDIAPKQIALDPGDSRELNFGNQGGFVVSGVVTDGESLLEQVDVQLKSMDKNVKSHFGRTDAAGRFRLIHVPQGKYVFATLRPREAADVQAEDPNDLTNVLYEVVNIENDLQLTADYQTRSITKEHPIP